jgi:hypothetical protein
MPSSADNEEIELGRTFSKLTARSKTLSDEAEERNGHLGKRLGDMAYITRSSLESDERALNETEGSSWGNVNLEVYITKRIEVYEHRASQDQSMGLGAPQVTIEGPERKVVS